MVNYTGDELRVFLVNKNKDTRLVDYTEADDYIMKMRIKYIRKLKKEGTLEKNRVYSCSEIDWEDRAYKDYIYDYKEGK